MAESPVFLFHKPRGVVVTRSDELGRRTVFDILPAWARDGEWQAVGRLDLDTRGLLLLTRDGRLQEALARPGAHDKIYEIWIRGSITPAQIAQLLAGVPTAQGLMRAHAIQPMGGVGAKSRLMVTLREGRNRQLRRMFGALNDERTGAALKVVDIKRVAFGPIRLDIPSREWRWLTPAECTALGIPAYA